MESGREGVELERDLRWQTDYLSVLPQFDDNHSIIFGCVVHCGIGLRTGTDFGIKKLPPDIHRKTIRMKRAVNQMLISCVGDPIKRDAYKYFSPIVADDGLQSLSIVRRGSNKLHSD